MNSYTSVVRSSPIGNHGNEMVKEILDLPVEEFLVEKSKYACLVKAQSFSTFPTLRMLYFDEGYEDLTSVT